MPITGVHTLLYSSEPEALRATLRDVFGFPFVEDHPGWLIFALPPGELGIHPQEQGPGVGVHQLTFMCDDIKATIAELAGKGVDIESDVTEEGWGIHTIAHLPGGVDVMIYEPRHALAI
jgi:catechol 2,3-dioxygenase-like lactoylglutathione lyase family enzyme